MPAAQVDGGQQLHQAATVAARHEVPQQGQPGRAGLLGWNWAARKVPRVASAASLAAVVAPAAVSGPTSGREGVHEVDPGSQAGPRNGAGSSSPHACRVFHCICGCFTPAGKGPTTPGKMPRPAAPGLSTEPS